MGISFLLGFGICVFVLVTKEINENIKFRKEEKEWIENSFEHDGARFSKEYFRLVDGKITHSL